LLFNKKSNQTDLTYGPMLPLLSGLTWPMVLGLLGMVLFNLADIYFIGKVGVHELAAMGFIFPVVMVVNGLASGIGIGTSSLISRTFVCQDKNILKQYATEACLLGLIFVSIVVMIGQLTIEPLFRSMGASDKVLPLIENYMRIWYWGMLVLVIPIVGNNIIRASGDTFTPGMLMIISAIINILLDPLLIFGYGPFPALSIRGAAIATVIARGIGMVLIINVLLRRKKLLTLFIPGLKRMLQTWRKIFYVAIPAAASILITPLSIGIIIRIISKFGEEAVAAFGIVSRIEMFALIVVNALGSVMIIFAGQNWGKEKYGRLLKGFYISLIFSLTWGMLLFIVAQLWAKPVASFFSGNYEVIMITAKYLLIVSFSYGFQGILIIAANILDGINKPLPAAGLTALRMFGIYVPLAWLASVYLNLPGIFWSAFMANLITGILSYFWLWRCLRKQ